jgi:cytochrome c oxidase subunit I
MSDPPAPGHARGTGPGGPGGDSFVRRYVFSTDHKVIGIQYGVTALLFLLVGFTLMMMMRWQLAYPDEPFPTERFTIPIALTGIIVLAISRFRRGAAVVAGLGIIGVAGLVHYLAGGENTMPGGYMLPEFYNSLGAMHGTIMIFLGVVPLGVGAFGNYVMPLQIGAPDMAFPRLNMMSYWIYLAGGIVLLAGFFVPGGAANSGWTSYPPLANIATTGQTVWLSGMVLLITSSLIGSVNSIVTVVQLRAPGLTFMRLPFFVWTHFVSSFLLLLAFPPLEAAGILQLMDRLAGTSFFLPAGLIVSGEKLAASGGGSPLLWQHLFWFLAHPEVYVLILPALGIVAEVITANARKPLWGYRWFVYAVVFLGFMSFLVWAHHMFISGMASGAGIYFQTTTMIISVPSVVILTGLVVSLSGGSIRFTTPMLFALGFLPMFALGGLTGLPLGLAATDVPLHDTYYVIGHFHYIVAPGALFALFAGIYHWFPKITGRVMDDRLGKVHFWGSIVAMNVIFFPMLIQGLAGVSRRLYDAGMQYAHAQGVLHLNEWSSVGAWALGLFQVVFVANLFMSLTRGAQASENHWQATTLDWSAAPTPPLRHGNFAAIPVVRRGPYEYSAPGAPADFTPQHAEDPR